MKKITFLLCLVLCLSVANAKTVTSEQAQAIARSFLQSQSELSPKGTQEVTTEMSEVYRATSKVGETPLYYIFNREGAPGFVIVSGDDRATEVLGYSTESNFDADRIPANVEWWLSQYAGEIEHAILSGDETLPPDNRMKAASNWAAISPLITTTWNQNMPYSMFCPKIGTTPCYTGCVATMMAQVMKYYEWPPKGMGYNEYTWNGQTLSMDFSTVTFDWDKMPASGEPLTGPQKQAVAKLMQACGYSVNMDYSLDASAASMVAARSALVNNFQYDAEYLKREGYEGDWEELIYNELSQKRPVCYSGHGTAGGHAFICDGYTPTGMFHINWGWGGYLDGYFKLNALKPDNSGTYNNQQSIIYAIRPVEFAKVDGVWYSIVDNVATVTTPRDKTRYEGDFVVPSAITYEGKTYPVVKMDNDVMSKCKNLTSFVVEAPIIEEIGNSAFSGSNTITKVSLPSSVKTIGFGAFSYCQALREVNLGDNVEIIGNQAFYNCGSLQNIDMGNKLREIDNYAFSYCKSMKNVTIPKTIERIGSEAFYECSGINDLVFGDALVDLGDRSFYEIPTLESVTFGKSLKKIKNTAFYGCENLTTVHLGEGLEEIEGHTFANCAKLAEVTFPSTLEVIGNYAFAECNGLTEINLPSSLKVIGNYAFYYDQGLTRLTMGNNIETIGDHAFSNCINLTEVVLPNSVKHIGDYAFYYLKKLNYVRLGGYVERIGREAFFNYEEIDRIDCYAVEPPVYGESVFYISAYWSNPELHVCKGLTETYKAAAGWNGFVNIIDDLNAEEGGVDDIFVDNRPETNNVYSISGALIKENATEAELQTLPAGVYIFGNRKIVR